VKIAYNSGYRGETIRISYLVNRISLRKKKSGALFVLRIAWRRKKRGRGFDSSNLFRVG